MPRVKDCLGYMEHLVSVSENSNKICIQVVNVLLKNIQVPAQSRVYSGKGSHCSEGCLTERGPGTMC